MIHLFYNFVRLIHSLENMKTKQIVASLLLSTVLLSSCKKSDPLPVFDNITDFFSSNKPQATTYTINVDSKADTIITNFGSMFVFPQGAFDKTGDIELKITEMNNLADFILTNTPNGIDSTFNANPLVFDISSAAKLNSGKMYKVVMYNKGASYGALAAKNNNVWSVVNAAKTVASEPEAGDGTEIVIFENPTRSFLLYNQLGTFCLSKNPIAAKAKKMKVGIKLYGFVNTPNTYTYIVSKDKNAVNSAKRITDSEFLSDSLEVGGHYQIVSVCYNQKNKYLGFSDAIIQDSVKTIPVSLYEASTEQVLKANIEKYFDK
jgi:hypothetical protein